MLPGDNLMKNIRGAASAQFPGKLHDMISFAEAQGLAHIIGFVQGGTAIMVHDPEKLLEILPHFGFSQTKYRSFQRQLNMWHFERVLEGKYKGAWIHPCFLRGNKPLCSLMSRHGAPPTADEVQKMLSQNQKLRMLLPNCISLPQQHPDKVTVSHGPDNSGVRSGLPMNTWTYEPAPFFANKTEVVSSTQYHTVDTAKYICDMDDMWTPLPADSPSLDDSINSSKEDLDFLEGLQPMLSSNQPELMLEPTPLRESSVSRSIPVSHAGLTQLLEPLATMDDIF